MGNKLLWFSMTFFATQINPIIKCLVLHRHTVGFRHMLVCMERHLKQLLPHTSVALQLHSNSRLSKPVGQQKYR